MIFIEVIIRIFLSLVLPGGWRFIRAETRKRTSRAMRNSFPDFAPVLLNTVLTIPSITFPGRKFDIEIM